MAKSRRERTPKTVLKLPDLEIENNPSEDFCIVSYPKVIASSPEGAQAAQIVTQFALPRARKKVGHRQATHPNGTFLVEIQRSEDCFNKALTIGRTQTRHVIPAGIRA